MPLRTRSIIAGVVILVLLLAWFFVIRNPQQRNITELQQQQEAARTQLAQLQAQLERLRQLQRDEPRLRAELARLENALPADPRLPDFILQVHESANLAGIQFLSIAPSVPAAFAPQAVPGVTATPEAGLQAISVNISTTGKFFELEDFIVRMERLPRAVRINNFGLAPGGTTGDDANVGTSPSMSVSFQMQMFTLSVPGAAAAPAAPAATPPGSPAATPAPGETPAPTPAPG